LRKSTPGGHRGGSGIHQHRWLVFRENRYNGRSQAEKAREQAMAYHTALGSLKNYTKGSLDIVNDDKKHYAFSNLFEVANKAKPFERVAVTKNIEYVVEVAKIDGTSPWYAAAHDEFVVVMDGDITINFVKLDPSAAVPSGKRGATKLAAAPNGQKMGYVRAKLGNQALLPAGAAYQLVSNGAPGVVLFQTLGGDVTVERWKDICIS